MNSNPIRGIVLVLLATLCFSTLDVAAKYVLQRVPLPITVWTRYAVHCLLMLVFLAPSMRWKLLQTRRRKAMILRSLMLVATTGFGMAAMRLMPLAELTAMVYLSPLLVALLSGPLLKEHLDGKRWALMVAGFCGVLLIARPGGAISSEAFILAGITALAYAVYQLQTRQLSPTENTWTLLFYSALVGTLIFAVTLPASWPAFQPNLVDSLLLVSIGCLGATGHFLLTRAFRYAPAATLSPFLYIQLVWSTLNGGIFFKQWPDHVSLLGMLLIAACSIAMALLEQRRNSR